MTTRLIPLTKWQDYHLYPNIAGLRYLVFNGEKNGFSSCVRRIGRRILIDEEAYYIWVNAQQMGPIIDELKKRSRRR